MRRKKKTYETLNRLLTTTENNQTVTYVYDDALKTITVTDPKGNAKIEEYDKANRLFKVINNNKITQYVYNADGSMQKQINPNTTSTYEYYADKKIKRLTTKDVNDILIEENYYEYDSNNNVTKENDKVYTYDALNRVKTSNNTQYEYDTSGNILTKSVLEGTLLKVTGYVYNAKNELLSTSTLENTTVVSESSFTYDSNGNQLTETTNNVTTTNIFNKRNELIQVSSGQVSNYTYNAEGKRIQKEVDNTTTNFVYDLDNVILELDQQNNQIATNTYGLKLLKRTTDKEGFYLYNGHGDVTKILDNTNTTLNSYVYDEFGKLLSETETFNNPFKYAGYYYDKETKTYYLQARYYNPEIQRFISEDTYRGQLEDPLSLNLYTYVKNNPLIYVDPSGHFFEEIASGFKYVGERAVAAVHAGAELAYDTVKGTAGLAWNLGETLGNEIGFVGNEALYNVGLMGQEQYLNNRQQRLSVINDNMNMYMKMPVNMAIGVIDNFKTTFNTENILNYLNPNTSYEELKNYSKSAIHTGTTIYGGLKILQASYNKVNCIVENIQNSKLVTSTSTPLSKIDYYVDLTGYRKAHILNRHMAGVGKSGKTEFPSSWSNDRILHNVSDVATDPKSITGIGKYNSPYAIGIRDRIQIRVDFYPVDHPKYSGMISTAYPSKSSKYFLINRIEV